MDINGWLTVITVFTAIFALLPKEDLFLRFLRTSRFERFLFVIINIALIPYLIYFERIAQRWTCFEMFTVSWGFCPENIAFALFFISFLWLLFRLFSKPKAKADKKIIDFYKDLLNEKPFDEFFKLFTKYTTAKNIFDDWEHYKELLFQPKFLNNILENKPAYLLQFWEKFNTENDFQSIFRLFLENPKSAYYAEIKEHWNSYSLLDDKPFLSTVIKNNIEQSIRNGILMVFTDYVSRHLRTEYGQQSIYNQQHYHPFIRKEEGFELPLYYHICFIGLMYATAIKNRVDIGAISRNHNMQTIYSGMVKQMMNNIIVTEQNMNDEYPTNYHWLISEIFKWQSNWLASFGVESDEKEPNFIENSSYVSFIPNSISITLSELYAGFNKEKITIEFLNSQIYYNVLSHYFDAALHNNMKTSIENKIIQNIPNEHLKPILEFALDERFALNFADFINENFNLLQEGEPELVLRLLNFLRTNNKIESGN